MFDWKPASIRLYLIIAGFFFACNSVAAESVLVRSTASRSGVDEIDPHGRASWVLSVVKRDLFEPLVKLDIKGNLIGGVAHSWRLSDDGLTWRFKLRKDVFWSDGIPVTAKDFVFTFNHWPDENRRSSMQTSKIVGLGLSDPRPVGVRAVDEHTLEIDLTEPHGLPVAEFRKMSYTPLPSHAAPAQPTLWSRWPNRPSNGAYQLVSIDKGANRIYLKSNPHVRAELKGSFTEVIHQLELNDKNFVAFLNNEVDVLSYVIPAQIEYFSNQQLNLFPFLEAITYFSLNQRDPDMNKHVRKAIQIAIDKRRIVRRLFPFATELVKPAEFMAGNVRLKRQNQIGTDLNQARRLMKQAGYGPKKRLQLTLLEHERSKIGGLFAEDLARIYIDLKVKIVPAKPLAEMHAKGDFQITHLSRFPSNQSIYGFLSPCVPAENFRCGFFKNSEFERLLAESRNTKSEKMKLAKLNQAIDLLRDEALVIPIYHSVQTLVLANHLTVDSTRPVIANVPSYLISSSEAKR